MGVAAAVLAAGDVVQVEDPPALERDVTPRLDEGQVPPGVVDPGQRDQPDRPAGAAADGDLRRGPARTAADELETHVASIGTGPRRFSSPAGTGACALGYSKVCARSQSARASSP